MNKKRLILALLVMTMVAGVAFAKKSDDFNPADLEKLLKGQKCLIGVKLEGANLKGMDLSNVDFRGAELEKVNFENANLTNVNFENADLEAANLKGAKITGANFAGAELEYATWSNGRVCAEDSLGGCW